MKLYVCHLLLPPLLLSFHCHCLAAVDGKIYADNQHSIYKINHQFEAMSSGLKVKNEYSKYLFLTSNSSRADSLCPSAAAIAPCTCAVDSNNSTFFDCTFVESVDQLVEVFQQDFPVKALYDFGMSNNDAITGLPSFMNGITFESVNLNPGPFILSEISEPFLFDLKDTLRELVIYGSKLSTDFFPFSMLPSMYQLEELRIASSDINWIPPIRAPKLSRFHLVDSYVERLLSGTFSIGTGPMTIWVDNNPIHTIEVGSFFFEDQNSANSNELISIDGYFTKLQSLQAGIFPLRNGPMSINFPSNNITSIEPGTFVLPASTDLLTLQLNLDSNDLETVDEAVFGSLMPFITHLGLYDNPLTCGCDIAWLILNENFLGTLDGAATCSDGTNLYDLDPQQYIDFC